MENFDKKVFSEVIDILNHSDIQIVERIPKKIITFLLDNANDEYEPNIDFYNENWDDTIQEDTKAILALIYRDYIVSDDEKNNLLYKEREELTKKEEELKEKYNIDNLFKNKNTVSEISMVEYKEPILKKIWDKIKQIFIRK